MQTSGKILMATALMAAGIAGAGVYIGRQSQQADEGQKARIAALVSTFKDRCPTGAKDRGCFYEPSGLVEAAKNYVAVKRFKEAGLVYVRIGDLDNAKNMMSECEKSGDKEGAESIKGALSDRADAIVQYNSEMSKSKPTASASAQAAPAKSSSPAGK